MAAMSSTPSPSANALRPNSYACCKEDSPIPAIESRRAAVYWSSNFSMVPRMMNLFQKAPNEYERVVRAFAVLGRDAVGYHRRRIACGQVLGKTSATPVGCENQRIALHQRDDRCAQRRELVADHPS